MSTPVFIGITLVLAALLLGTTFGHVLEMPVKLKVEGPRWVNYQNTLYRYFASVGGPIEIAAIVAALIVAFLLRGEGLAFYLALSAAALLAVAFFGVRMFVISRVNQLTAIWRKAPIPADWSKWRDLWEYSHAARFVLHLLAFIALVWAVLAALSGPPT